jgi:hypothetical protein
MKYTIMRFGEAATMMETATPEWIEEMIEFMVRLDKDLTGSGELVFQQGLADGSTAKTVRATPGVPVTTDGPFARPRSHSWASGSSTSRARRAHSRSPSGS